jgi:hypothetical protein
VTQRWPTLHPASRSTDCVRCPLIAFDPAGEPQTVERPAQVLGQLKALISPEFRHPERRDRSCAGGPGTWRPLACLSELHRNGRRGEQGGTKAGCYELGNGRQGRGPGAVVGGRPHLTADLERRPARRCPSSRSSKTRLGALPSQVRLWRLGMLGWEQQGRRASSLKRALRCLLTLRRVLRRSRPGPSLGGEATGLALDSEASSSTSLAKVVHSEPPDLLDKPLFWQRHDVVEVGYARP